MYYTSSRMTRLDWLHVRVRGSNDVNVYMEHISQTLCCNVVTPGCRPQSGKVLTPTQLLTCGFLRNRGDEMILLISRLHIFMPLNISFSRVTEERS
jgi:hypothetical protein